MSSPALVFFSKLVASQKQGIPSGITSICSAHPRVVAAAMAQAKEDGLPLLFESTVNQVNQFGGYTGMKPADFRTFVLDVAERAGFPAQRVIFGGDHLGPYPWRKEPAAQAMEKACELVSLCVKAGYSKIHLDASMALAGDPPTDRGAPDAGLIARREARLAAAAESAAGRPVSAEGGPAPVYVIGTDVPPPGGIQAQEDAVPVTPVEEFEQTVASCRSEFQAAGLEDAWSRVIAVVVQPGVEFGDHEVYEYNRAKAATLVSAARGQKGIVLEGHSTDYQTPDRLRQLVEDGVAILKVGPALTFALRECLFALEGIEKELLGGCYKTRLSQVELSLEKAMQDNPAHWSSYYQGDAKEVHLARKFSFSDRSRYYWQVPMVKEAVEQLMRNLGRIEIPMTLISQYLPRHYLDIRRSGLKVDLAELIEASIRMVLLDYSAAVLPSRGS